MQVFRMLENVCNFVRKYKKYNEKNSNIKKHIEFRSGSNVYNIKIYFSKMFHTGLYGSILTYDFLQKRYQNISVWHC